MLRFHIGNLIDRIKLWGSTLNNNLVGQVFDQTSDVLNVGLSGYDDPDTITSTTRKMTIKFTTNEDNSQITPASLGAGRWKFNYVFNME